jgi:predicted ATP-grasp superfamily ATP-dependent carboligase
MKNATPVVILRSTHHGGLGILRSLGRLGVPVYCVDARYWEAGFTSRYCRRRFIVDTESLKTQESVSSLLEIGQKIGGQPILIPTTDQTAMWLAEHGPSLRPAFRFATVDAALVTSLCDKGRMQDLARQSGVPTAQAVVPRSKLDVEQFIEASVFPVMVKATDAGRFRRLTGRTKFVIQSPAELLALHAKVGDCEEPSMLIQEFIPGEDWMFNGYFDSNSECLFGICGKKIRRFPVQTGVTSLGICLRNDVLKEITTGFMKAIGYHGILDIGYRYDVRDQQYKVMDVNPRVGCTFRLFTGSDGSDVARALYLDMTDQRVPASETVHGRKWIVEDFDLFSLVRSWKSGTIKLNDYLTSLRGIQETACFAWDDPLPFFMMPLVDYFEWYKWFRCQIGVRHSISKDERNLSKSPVQCPSEELGQFLP